MTSEDPSSSDHLIAWQPVPRAPFGEQKSLVQVVVRVGQGVGPKFGLKAARREECWRSLSSGAWWEWEWILFRPGHCGISSAHQAA